MATATIQYRQAGTPATPPPSTDTPITDFAVKRGSNTYTGTYNVYMGNGINRDTTLYGGGSFRTGIDIFSKSDDSRYFAESFPNVFGTGYVPYDLYTNEGGGWIFKNTFQGMMQVDTSIPTLGPYADTPGLEYKVVQRDTDKEILINVVQNSQDPITNDYTFTFSDGSTSKNLSDPTGLQKIWECDIITKGPWDHRMLYKIDISVVGAAGVESITWPDGQYGESTSVKCKFKSQSLVATGVSRREFTITFTQHGSGKTLVLNIVHGS